MSAKVADKADVVRLLKAGVSGAETARRLGVSRARISQIRIELGMRGVQSKERQAIEQRRQKLKGLIAGGLRDQSELRKRLRCNYAVLHCDALALGVVDVISLHAQVLERHAAVVRMSEKGLPVRAQAARLDCLRSRVSKDRVQLGIAEKRDRTLIRERRARTAELVKRGYTNNQIAERLGASIGLIAVDVSRLYGNNELKRRTSPANVWERRGKVSALLSSGLTVHEIMHRLSLPRHTVRRDINVMRGASGTVLQAEGCGESERAVRRRLGKQRRALQGYLKMLHAQGTLA